MTRVNNNLPPYAEEITLNQTTEQIQEVLNKFKQPIPSNFVELENLKHMCSTQGWKEPVCERYGCLIKGEWKQVDIRCTLLEKLELAKNILCPIYLSPTVLDKGLDHLAYTIELLLEFLSSNNIYYSSQKKTVENLLTQLENCSVRNNDRDSSVVKPDNFPWKLVIPLLLIGTLLVMILLILRKRVSKRR